MTLTTKFNVALAVVFAVGIALTTTSLYYVLTRNAHTELIDRAGLMMAAAKAVRHYTANEIRPLLTPHMRDEFLPQTIPAYAAAAAFHNLRTSEADNLYKNYLYREAALNPTNQSSRALDWEADIIQQFSNDKNSTELVGERDTPSGPSLYLARPIRVTAPSCLECHGSPADAPKSQIAKYGSANGFGWELDEVVGAQIVSIPSAVPKQKAQQVFIIALGLLVGGVAVIGVTLNVMLRLIVVSRATNLAGLADQVSRGKLDSPPFDDGGNDEMSTLARSFNRMRRSLEKAIKLLE